MSNNNQLINRLIEHEGLKRFVYQDSLGYWTIGCGRNVDSRSQHGLTIEEQRYLLNNDIQSCIDDLIHLPVYIALDQVRKEVLIELTFNMGIVRLLNFKNTLAAIHERDYEKAVAELKDSLWAKQVHSDRVDDICYRLLYGEYQ